MLKLIIPLLLVFLSTFTACHQKQKFDKAEWQEVGDLMTFPNRNAMVDDVAQNHNLKGKTLNDITGLLLPRWLRIMKKPLLCVKRGISAAASPTKQIERNLTFDFSNC